MVQIYHVSSLWHKVTHFSQSTVCLRYFMHTSFLLVGKGYPAAGKPVLSVIPKSLESSYWQTRFIVRYPCLSTIPSYDCNQNASVIWPQQAGQAFLPTSHHLSNCFSHIRTELSWEKSHCKLITVTKKPWQQNTWTLIVLKRRKKSKEGELLLHVFLEKFFQC